MGQIDLGAARLSATHLTSSKRIHTQLSEISSGDKCCRNVSELYWSPAGRNIILAGLAGTQGALEFFNVDDMSTLRLQQHFMCNNVKWDQTGRYACTWVDAHRDMDHGYVMWSFTGEMLYRYFTLSPLQLLVLRVVSWSSAASRISIRSQCLVLLLLAGMHQVFSMKVERASVSDVYLLECI